MARDRRSAIGGEEEDGLGDLRVLGVFFNNFEELVSIGPGSGPQVVEVGAGRKPVEWVKEVLEAKNRQVSGPKAPACGLYFLRATYPEKYRWSSDA